MAEYYKAVKKQESVIENYKKLCKENGWNLTEIKNELLIIRNVKTKKTIDEYVELMIQLGYEHNKLYLENRFNKEAGAMISIGLNMKEEYQIRIEITKGQEIKRNLSTIIKELENI